MSQPPTTQPPTKQPSSDVGILGTCACGGGPSELNFDCERCRMVYTLQLASDVRSSQIDYFHDRSRANLERAKQLEAKLDRALAKLLLPPAAQQPDQDTQLQLDIDSQTTQHYPYD